MGIADLFTLFEKLQSRDITIHQERCAAVRNRNARCRRCAKACTSGAISLVDDQITITPERCVGCGTCATVCPTGAIEAHRPDDEEFLAACRASMEACHGQPVIACEQACAHDKGFDPQKVVVLTCLGRIEESLLTTLAAEGATKIHLVGSDCEHCERAAGCMTLQKVFNNEQTILSVWHAACTLSVSTKMPPCAHPEHGLGYDPSKRSFLVGFKDDAKDAAGIIGEQQTQKIVGAQKPAKQVTLRADHDGHLPQQVPARRAQLIEALKALGQPDDDLIETRLWGHVIIDPKLCDSCRMCATFCPTGALWKFDDENGESGVEFFPGNCVRCRICVDICKKHAIMQTKDVFARDLVDGRTERFVMRPPIRTTKSPRVILDTMRELTGSDTIHGS